MDEILKKNLITELGINNLPYDEQEEIINRSAKIVFQSILNRVIPLLSAKEKGEFEALLDDKSMASADVFVFLNEKIPNLDEINKKEIYTFKKEGLNVMSKIG